MAASICGEGADAMGPCNIVLSYVAPTIGILLALTVQLSPLRALLTTHRTGKLPPEFNTFPIAIQLWNALLGINYASVILDFFVFVPNFTGLVLNLLYWGWVSRSDIANSTYFKLHYTTVVGLCSIAQLINTIVNIQIVPYDREQAQLVMGIICTISLTIFYASPLSSMKQVIQKRDSSSIYLPLTITAGLGAAFWAAYGFAVLDPWIYGPNCAGVVLALLQVALCIIFPRKKARTWFTFKRSDRNRLGKMPDDASITGIDDDIEQAAHNAVKAVETSVALPDLRVPFGSDLHVPLESLRYEDTSDTSDQPIITR
jgi:solute carrier family 50 protein (sugar transporter)